MNPRSKLTLLLFCVVAGLTIFLVTTKTRDENLAPPVVSAIPADSIENIAIERLGKDTIELTKNRGPWQITAPLQLDANPARVNAILQIRQAPSRTRLNAEDVDLSTLGLETPTTTLRLDEHVFSFGATDALDDRRYVMFARHIHLIEDRVYHLLRQEPLFFASPRLWREDLLLAELAHPAYRLYKKDTWLMTTGQTTTAEGAELLLKAWHNVEAQSLRPYSAGEALGRISVKTEQGQTIAFFIMAKEPTLILARPDLGIEYHLDNDTTRKLFRPKSAIEIEENASSPL